MKGVGYLKKMNVGRSVDSRSIIIYERLLMKEDSGMIYFCPSLNDFRTFYKAVY